ncbi:hypothetical protein V493_04345 [Pseudogymnoascus sp. VKM F-4281 (FW-2241)]|nr:hypothetical protein V493_04345 [Pseudogymnoascus sp. VKM F-4281 (FW-2241)]
MESIDSPTRAAQTLLSPPSKRTYDVVKLDSNGDEATATAKCVQFGSQSPVNESDGCSEVDLILPERQVLPLNLDNNVGPPSEEIKQSGGYTNGTLPAIPKIRPKPILSLVDVYEQPCAAEPDFGVPDEHAVPVIVPRSDREMVVPKGPGRPSTTYSSRNRTVRTGPDRPQPSSAKMFDLTTSHARRRSVEQGAEQAAKRRKISSNDSIDEIQYEQTRSTTASSRPTKTVMSGIPPLERKHPGQTFGIDEFKRVENTIKPSNPRRRPSCQLSSAQSSREGTMVIDDEDDIQDSDIESAKPPEPYRGTANRKPARTKEEMDAKNNVRKRTGPPSVRFSSSSSKSSRALVASGAGGSNHDVANGSTQDNRVRLFRMVNGKPEMSFESVSDDEDELSMDKSGPGAKRTNAGTVIGHLPRSPTSGSISKAGDIRSSLPRQIQQKPFSRALKPGSQERPRISVSYLRSASNVSTPIGGEEPIYLQYNPKTSRMDVIRGNENVSEDKQYSSYTFNTTAVKKITYSMDNYKAALVVTEKNITSLPKLLLEGDKESFYNFVMFLHSRSQAAVFDESGDKLERIFANTIKSYDDLNRLKQRRASLHEASDAGLTGDGKRPRDFDGSEEPPRTKKLHEKLQNGSSNNETSKLESQGRQVRRNANDNDNRPATRSTRGQNKESRIRSPSPQRYTHEHRDWQIYWAGGNEPLLFPLEGTNKANVDMRDIERLDEGQCLNDNLIAFYLRYLQDISQRNRPDVFKRVFFMNTFFYPRLTKGKGRKNIDYDAVKRWTSKVNIFDYDYIVVPVNESFHWYLAIICNVPKLLLPPEERITKEDKQVHEEAVVDLDDAGDIRSPAQFSSKEGSVTPEMASKVSRLSIEDRVASPEPQPNGAKHIDAERINLGTPNRMSTADDDTDRPQKVTSSAVKGRKGKRKSIPPVRKYNTEEPRIITLDSQAYAHSPTCSNLRDFLIAEAKEKLDVDITLDQPSIGMTAKNIPQQGNFFDCGLFLLGYVEGFLDHPEETIHGIMQGRTDMASSFPKMNAPEMRNKMRELIFKLRRDQVSAEHEARKAERAAEKAAKVKEGRPTGESKNASSASTSPKPPVPPKSEVKMVEELDSASETKDVLKPFGEVTSVIEGEQPTQESPPMLEESVTIDSFMDHLAGIPPNTAKDKEATEPSPLNTSPPIEEPVKNADRRAISDETSNHKVGPTRSRHFKLTVQGQKPKFRSPNRSRQRKGASEANVVESPSTPPPRPPRQQLRSSPRNQIEIQSNSSEDSLRVVMSPSVRGRKAAHRNADEIPDSQGDDVEQGGRQDVDKGKLVEDLTETTAGTRAGDAARKRQKDTTTEMRKRKSGASAMFGGGSPREKGRKKDPLVVDDE